MILSHSLMKRGASMNHRKRIRPNGTSFFLRIQALPRQSQPKWSYKRHQTHLGAKYASPLPYQEVLFRLCVHPHSSFVLYGRSRSFKTKSLPSLLWSPGRCDRMVPKLHHGYSKLHLRNRSPDARRTVCSNRSSARASPSLYAKASRVSDYVMPVITNAEAPNKLPASSLATAAIAPRLELLETAASALILASPTGGGIHPEMSALPRSYCFMLVQ